MATGPGALLAGALLGAYYAPKIGTALGHLVWKWTNGDKYTPYTSGEQIAGTSWFIQGSSLAYPPGPVSSATIKLAHSTGSYARATVTCRNVEGKRITAPQMTNMLRYSYSDSTPADYNESCVYRAGPGAVVASFHFAQAPNNTGPWTPVFEWHYGVDTGPVTVTVVTQCKGPNGELLPTISEVHTITPGAPGTDGSLPAADCGAITPGAYEAGIGVVGHTETVPDDFPIFDPIPLPKPQPDPTGQPTTTLAPQPTGAPTVGPSTGPTTGPSTAPSSAPSTAPSTGPSSPPTTGASASPRPGPGDDVVNPPSGDTSGCMGEAAGWNPVHWILVPVKCALIWAFVPTTIGARWATFNGDVSGTAPWSYALAGPAFMTPVLAGFHTPAGCSGAHVAQGPIPLPLDGIQPWCALDRSSGSGPFTVGTMRTVAIAGIWIAFLWACYMRAQQLIGIQKADDAAVAAMIARNNDESGQ